MSNPIGMYNVHSFLYRLKEELENRGLQVEAQQMKISSSLLQINKRVNYLKVVKNNEVILDIDATDPDGYFLSVSDDLDKSAVSAAIENGDMDKVLEELKIEN